MYTGQITLTDISDNISYQIRCSSPVFFKDSTGAMDAGNFSTVIIRGIKTSGEFEEDIGFFTITENGAEEDVTATPTPIELTPDSTSTATSFSIRLYSSSTKTNLLDSVVIPVVWKGASAIASFATNNSSSIPTDELGGNGNYSGTGTDIYVYEGASVLTYDGVGTSNGTWKISSTTATNITADPSPVDQGTFARVGNASAITSDTASVRYGISGKSRSGVAFTSEVTLSFSRIKAGSPSINVLLSNEAHTFSASASGAVVSYTNSGTEIHVYHGTTELTYDGVGTSNGTWKISSTTATNITAGGVVDSGVFATVGDHSMITDSIDSSAIIYVVTGKTQAGASFSATKTQTFSKSRAGDTPYTWLKYADSPTSGMSDTPTGKTYIGIALNKNSVTESTSYEDYSWSLIKGADGIGVDGTTYYTWIKYATNATGTTGLSDDPVGCDYIGLAFNKPTSVESSTPTDYSWSLIRGPIGSSGHTLLVVRVYQNAASAPATPSGIITCTFATGALSGGTMGSWSTTQPAASTTPTYMTQATWTGIAPATTSSTQSSWSTPVIVAQSGAAGSQGASSRMMYARIANNPTPVTGTFTTSGNTSFPDTTSHWGLIATWSESDPDTSSTDTLYQADGIYNPATGNTVWSTPYISSLRVGSLSAISTNTGSLDNTGTFTSGSSPALSGTTMTGSGLVAISDGTGAWGTPDSNIAFNGTKVTLNGQVVFTENIVANNISVSASANGGINNPSFVLTTSGGSVFIIATVNVYNNSYSRAANLAIYIDGVQVGVTSTCTCGYSPGGSGTPSTPLTCMYSSTPAPGNHTFSASAWGDLATLSGRCLFAIELKR